MDELLKGLKDFIKSENIFEPNERILIAVSGGVDSVVLSHLMKELGYDIALAHVNFQLRGRSSDLDQQLIEDLALNWGVEAYFKNLDASTYADKTGISTQMAARELRYQWFSELSKEQNYQKIATAHHLNDQLETLLLNLTKGTGIAGLHGIFPVRGSIARPLLFARKEEILDYGKNKKLTWREDESNEQDYYQRNLIRNKVVPILKMINPNLEESARNTMEIMRSIEKQYFKSIEQLQKRLFQTDGPHVVIQKKNIASIEPPILHEVLKDYGFSYSQCKSLMGKALIKSGNLFESDSHQLNVDRDTLIISPKVRENSSLIIIESCQGLIDIDGHTWHLSGHEIAHYEVRQHANVAALDHDKLVFPLKVRDWLPGDRFCPLGMAEFKKISDFLIDAKVPRNHKTAMRVLTSNEEIIWVIGQRIDDRYKITERTQRVLEIEINTEP